MPMRCVRNASWFTVVIASAVNLGCANVKVDKVSVEDRLSGNDRCVQGFRYYLNRPYIVVGRQISAGTIYVPAIPVKRTPSLHPTDQLRFLAAVPDRGTPGVFQVFDAQGNWVESVPPPDLHMKYEHVQILPPAAPLPKAGSTTYADSNPGGGTGMKKPTQTPPTQPTTPADAIQVVFLPDFEEQYAIRNKNCQAKTKYKYTFRNGTELAGMAGSYNSTDVPVMIVETVGSLLQAAGQVAMTAIQPASALTQAASSPTTRMNYGAGGKTDPDPNPNPIRYYVKIEHVLEPGIYRVQKSWERAAAMPLDGLKPEQFPGLFADVGLEIREVTSIIASAQHDKETAPKKDTTGGSKDEPSTP
jgi:hypothetical protein